MATGWDNGLSQDYNRKLGAWFAERLGAKRELREMWSAVDERHDNDLLPMQSGLGMSKLKSLTIPDRHKVEAKATLQEAMDETPDTVIALCTLNQILK